MSTHQTRYHQRADRFAVVAAQLDDAHWDNDSPCSEWSAREVVAHIIDTQRQFLDGRGVTLPDAPALDDPHQAWTAHAASVVSALGDAAVGEASYDGFFGPTTVGETLLTFYGFDMIVHRWDVARAGGVATTFTDEEMDTLDRNVAGFGEHLYGEGICQSAVEMTADSSRQDQLLAKLGRDPS